MRDELKTGEKIGEGARDVTGWDGAHRLRRPRAEHSVELLGERAAGARGVRRAHEQQAADRQAHRRRCHRQVPAYQLLQHGTVPADVQLSYGTCADVQFTFGGPILV